jgi:hypothetical protein
MDSADSLLLKMLTSTSLPLTSPDFARVETSTSAGEDDLSTGEGLPILLTFPRITFLPACCLADFLHSASKISSDFEENTVRLKSELFPGLKLTNFKLKSLKIIMTISLFRPFRFAPLNRIILLDLYHLNFSVSEPSETKNKK